jgi:predicted DNA-binding transcriptional regulator AlpA
MATSRPQFDVIEQTELLTIEEVEERTKMGHSWIYELIKRGEFPAPIHMGGSKWVAFEVEEFIQRRKDERDLKYGQSKFAPRARILHFQTDGARSAPISMIGVVDSVTANESTLRVLGAGLCAALRTLRIDIPELYLDQDSWQVNLLVMKIDRKQAKPMKNGLKRKKGQH